MEWFSWPGYLPRTAAHHKSGLFQPSDAIPHFNSINSSKGFCENLLAVSNIYWLLSPKLNILCENGGNFLNGRFFLNWFAAASMGSSHRKPLYFVSDEAQKDAVGEEKSELKC